MQSSNRKYNIRIVLFCVAFGAFALAIRPAAPLQAEPPAQAPSGVTEIFGIDEGGRLGSNPNEAAIAASAGVKWVRAEISWTGFESTQGVYNFTAAEQSINTLLNAGLTPIMYLANNPAWASNTRCGPLYPDKLDEFEASMQALAAYFQDKVQVWALYNEVERSTAPNKGGAGCFGSHTAGGHNNNGKSDSIDYAVMLATAWRGVKAGNPNAMLVTGALTYDNFDEQSAPNDYPGGGLDGATNYDFLDKMLKYMKKHPLPQGQKYFDMLVFNYFDLYARYWDTKASGHGIQAKASVLRSKLKAYKLPVVPLFVTETGANSYSLGEKLQAQCVTITFVRGAAAKLAGVVWWTFKDHSNQEEPPADTWNYGIVRANLAPKPSFTAMQTLTSQLNGYAFKKNLSNKASFASIEAYRFSQGTTAKIIVWSASHQERPYTAECSWARNPKLATFTANKIRVVDYLGKFKTIRDNGNQDRNPADGKISITVTGTPKIVELNPQ